MRQRLLSASALLFLAACELPIILGGEDDYQRPVSSTYTKHLDTLEQNSHVIYPGVALFTLALIAFGIIQAWRTQGLDGKEKSNYKREIVQELRRTLGGMTGDEIARSVGIEPFKAVKLLDEMVAEKMIVSHTNTERLTVYRLRGVGGK